MVRGAVAAHARARASTVSDVERLASLLSEAGAAGTVVFTGAGVSTESGIPDFRSPGGVWTRYAPIDYGAYMRDAGMRREAWRRGVHTYQAIADAQPNAAHRAIADWWLAQLVSGVVTQNIDGLHQRAGLPDQAVVELHGNAHLVACLTCEARFDRLVIHERLAAGEEDPSCPECGGILKSTTISFGQPLPVAAIARAHELHAAARLCLVIGSSLVVYPAAMLPEVTLETGGRLAIVNQTQTHLDHRATFVSRTPAAVLLGEVRAQQTTGR
jgi:NAD-dependent deacetylase